VPRWAAHILATNSVRQIEAGTTTSNSGNKEFPPGTAAENGRLHQIDFPDLPVKTHCNWAQMEGASFALRMSFG
jgi:hypothetical protein